MRHLPLPADILRDDAASRRRMVTFLHVAVIQNRQKRIDECCKQCRVNHFRENDLQQKSSQKQTVP